jgi:hypothetical protein
MGQVVAANLRSVHAEEVVPLIGLVPIATCLAALFWQCSGGCIAGVPVGADVCSG